jgi:hypothetical protein
MPSAERELSTVVAIPASREGAGRLGIPEVYAGIALLSFLVARFAPVLDVRVPCPFLLFTGHPCATCGMTHSFVYLAHGHVLGALRWSPLGALLAAGAWAYVVLDLVRLAAGLSFPAVPLRLMRRLVISGVVALLVNWAYLLIHGYGG